MAHDSLGTHNQPQYSGSGVPADAADLSEIANYAATVGGTKSGTAAQMNALSGADVWPGLLFANTESTDLGVYKWSGSAWLPLYGHLAAAPAAVMVGSVPTANSRILEQAGYVTVNTDANGDTSITYPTAFPKGVISARLQRMNFSNYLVTSDILNATQTLAALNFRIYSGGVGLASVTSVPYVYHAIGW